MPEKKFSPDEEYRADDPANAAELPPQEETADIEDEPSSSNGDGQDPLVTEDAAEETADNDDEVSLPLSARRSWYDRLEDDEDVSLPLSAAGPEATPIVTAPKAPPQPAKELPTEDQLNGRSLMVSLIMTAATIALIMISEYVPLLNIVADLFLPLPLLLLAFRWGMKPAIVGLILSFGFSALIFGVPAAALMIIRYGTLALVLAYCLRMAKKPLFALGIAALIAAFASILGIMLASFFEGLPFSVLTDQYQLVVTNMMRDMASMGYDNLLPAGMTMDMYVANLTDTLLSLLPAIVIIGSIVTAALSYLIAAAALRSSKYGIAKLPHFRDWRINWKMSWGVIAGLAFYLLGDNLGIVWMNDLGLNLLYAFGCILFVCGLSFMMWVFELDSFFVFLKILLCAVLIFFIRYGVLLLMLLALFDPIFDFRGKINKVANRGKKSGS